MRTSIYLLALVAGVLAVPAQEDREELLLVKTFTPEQVQFLHSFEGELDFWTHPMLNEKSAIRIPASRHNDLVSRWTAAGMEVEVKEFNIQDMIDRVEEENKIYKARSVSGLVQTPDNDFLFPHNEYYRYVLPLLQTLAMQYPQLVFFDESGNTPPRPVTAENRILHVIELGANRGSTPVIMLEVNIHAREHITAASNLYFMDWVLAKYGKDADATFLLDNFHLVIMPVANPDGYDYSHVSTSSTFRLWRKNRVTLSGTSCRGVDLNRNFNARWASSTISTGPCTEVYPGQAAASERETQAAEAIFDYFKDKVQVYMPVHCYSQLLLLPYSWATNPNDRPPNNAAHYAAADAMAKAMLAIVGRNHTYGQPRETIGYNAYGTSSDWALLQKSNMLAIAYELQPDRNLVSGGAGFVRPASEIIDTGREFAASVVAVAKYVYQYGVL